MQNKVSDFLDIIVRNVNMEAYTREEMMDSIREHLPKITRELHIGKIVVRYNSNTSLFGINDEINIDDELYFSDEELGEDSIERVFCTPIRSKVHMIVTSLKDTIWNEAEKSYINDLVALLFLLASRTRIYGLLEKAANYDQQCGVLNYSGIFSRVSKIMQQGDLHKYISIFMNIINMNYYNRQFGRKIGDVIMATYAQSIQNFLGEDGWIARRGGDNFTIFAKQEKLDELVNLLKAVKINIDFPDGEKTIYVRSRCGIYVNQLGDRLNQCFDRANIAVMETRAPGSNDVCYFEPEMQEKTIREQEMIKKMKRALLKHEFVPYYQPKVNVEQMQLCGAEALVRWIHDDQIVPPGAFIPLMERTGIIVDLDFEMLDNVCAQIKDWMDRGITPVRISTNFSREHLSNENLAEDIIRVVRQYGVDPKYIEIEITESSCYQNYDALKAFLEQMHKYNIRVAVDDFGTGYSSLNMLGNFDVDCIKLDKSFLDNVDSGNEKDKILFQNLMKMVLDLDLHVITEGVETQEQLEFLRKVKCDQIQGYYFDKPLPKEEFETRLQNPSYSSK